MSLKNNTIFARFFCAALTSFGISLSTYALHAQVPTTIPLAFADRNPNTNEVIIKPENTISKGRPVVKMIAPEIAIPFSTRESSVNLSLLDMRSNDQEFARNFVFKNTSTTACTIYSINFEKQDNMFEFITVEPGKTLPIEVAPGKTFTVHVGFHANKRNDLCLNRLSFLTNERTEPITYPIQALQLPFLGLVGNR